MNESEKLKRCAGCHDDFYNHRNTSDKCWMLPTMTLVRKKQVPVDQCPPWKQKAIWVPDCYHRSGFIYVNPSKT